MAISYEFKEEQWEKIKEAMPEKEEDPERSAEDNRKFVEAVLWVGRNGGKMEIPAMRVREME